MPIEVDWRTEYGSGVWDRISKEWRAPSYVIPSYLAQRYSRGSCTTMPGGPYVSRYTLQSQVGPRLNEYGQYPVIVDVQVEWKPEIQEAIKNRQTLLGDAAHTLNAYHGQFAFSFQRGLLAELQRKLNRAKLSYETVKRWHDEMDRSWFDFFKEIHQFVLERLKYDQFNVQDYVKEHESSVAIPGTRWFKSKKWSQLSTEELKHLYELGKEYLEDLLKEWDYMTKRPVQPNSIGRGIRARSPEVDSINTSYHFTIDRARQVGFGPWFSCQHAFLKHEDEQEIWIKTKKFAERKLGCDVLLPPLLKGAYWKEIDRLIKDNEAFVNGDGSMWEMHSATFTGLLNYACDDGILQWISGTFPTSYNATWASLMSVKARMPNAKFTAIGGIGDDQVLIGTKANIEQVKDIEAIWEIDHIATKHKCLLGMIILPDGKGTFPGLYRITVDRADKKISLDAGESIPNDKHPEPVTGDIPQDSFAVYREIMEQGTIHGEPVLDYIARKQEEEFYRLWRMDRDALYSKLSSQAMDVLPEDYEIDSF